VVKESRIALPELMQYCNQHQIEVETIEEFSPPFDDVFVKLIEDYGANE
jgi:hypothetical protein